jgi:hypothetical protein
MAGWDEVTTFEQLQAMTPQQRHKSFLASIVRNEDDLRPNERPLLERMREQVLEREARLRGEAS